MKNWEDIADLHELRQEQRQREMIARRVTTQRQERQRRARMDEERIIRYLERMGYPVHPTVYHCPFDVWAGNCRIEIKVSSWQPKQRRYLGNIRHHEADILLFDAINGQDHFFVIPMTEVKPRKTLEIYSYHVTRYKGQWAAYLENWSILDRAIAAAPPRPIQLGFAVNRGKFLTSYKKV